MGSQSCVDTIIINNKITNGQAEGIYIINGS